MCPRCDNKTFLLDLCCRDRMGKNERHLFLRSTDMIFRLLELKVAAVLEYRKYVGAYKAFFQFEK